MVMIWNFVLKQAYCTVAERLAVLCTQDLKFKDSGYKRVP